jgi:hypothetical protein
MLISRAINPDCLGTALVAEFFGLCLSSHFASIRVQAIVGDISRGHRLPLPHPLSGPRRTRPQDLQRRGLPCSSDPIAYCCAADWRRTLRASRDSPVIRYAIPQASGTAIPAGLVGARLQGAYRRAAAIDGDLFATIKKRLPQWHPPASALGPRGLVRSETRNLQASTATAS